MYAGGEYGVIDEMYVKPGFRGQGVGMALVTEAVSMARRRYWFRLDVTGPGSHGGALFTASRAIEFYLRLGFEFTGPKLRLLVQS